MQEIIIALKIMGMGMLGIFIAMTLILTMTWLLKKYDEYSKKRQAQVKRLP